MAYAEVAVNSPLAQRRTFSYSIPPHLTVDVGQAVWVPFGPKLLQGIVIELIDYPLVEEVKEIAAVIDQRPVLELARVELARWISRHYLSPLFDAVALMLPPGFGRKAITFIYPVSNPPEISLSSLPPQQRGAFNLIKKRGRVGLSEVEKAWGKKGAKLIIAQLLRQGLVTKGQELERVKIRPRVVPYLRLMVDADEARQEAARLQSKAPRQASLLNLLTAEPLPLSQARKKVACSASVVAALRAKGLVSLEDMEIRRDPLSHRQFVPSSPPPLTPAQQAAWRTIEESLQGGKGAVFLLHGVTGSGKTEIYLRALAQAIDLGKRGIALVPEIALTPQTIQRFASRFPGRVAVLHSQLSLGEQFDEWQRIREGEVDVVIGSRGAIFAPQPDLGLIVVDEEHEWAYKQQDRAPRYHAREVAIKLRELLGGVVVILGSATPDVESFYRAQVGQYRLLQLPQRISLDSSLPRVEVVDLREELKTGNRSIFSRSLSQAISEALASREQAILFLNRRGSATFIQCRNCSFVLRCKRCDVPLTYHSAGEDLVCHQCNYRMASPQICPQCGSRRIKFLGIGTQRVETEVGHAFPGAKLLRWDRDVTRGRRSHEQILDKFLAHEADILIGTQMIAKGLDLPLVTLVGAISADTGLHLPDFRAAERTFQILSQVAGRAGRGSLAGRVIIQTYNPEHYAIAAAAGHDFAAFYEKEIGFRRRYNNPPFSRLARLVYTHSNASACQREAERMGRLLGDERDSRGVPDLAIIGPAPAFVPRLRGRFRWQIILRGSHPASLMEEIPLPQGWSLDVDPLSLV
jgi:primosomal protein N' (replication factor Y)